MKFNVGDKVKTRDDLIEGLSYGGFDFYALMIAKSATVLDVLGNGTCRLDNGYYYSPEMLEPVVDEIEALEKKCYELEMKIARLEGALQAKDEMLKTYISVYRGSENG